MPLPSGGLTSQIPHWITTGFESDHGPELSAVISFRGRISANRGVTIKTKTNFNSCCYLRVIQYLGRIAIKYQ